MAEPRVRLFVKRKLRLDRLNFGQSVMAELGMFGLDQVKERIRRLGNSDDQRSKPLTRGYAIYKTKKGKGNVRNLRFSGKMLDNLSVRTVSSNFVRANMTTKLQRQKAIANAKIEMFWEYSPRNVKAVRSKAVKLLDAETLRLIRFERNSNV